MAKARITAPFPTERDIQQLLRVPKKRSDELYYELFETREARSGAPLHHLSRSRESLRRVVATPTQRSGKSVVRRKPAKKK